MNAVFIVMAAFVVVGLTFSNFDKKTRLLIFLIAATMITYITFK